MQTNVGANYFQLMLTRFINLIIGDFIMTEFELRKGDNKSFPFEARIGAFVRQFESEEEARYYLLKQGVL